MNTDNYQDPANKVSLVNALLPKVFAWCRAAGATQPLTSAIWQGDKKWQTHRTKATEKIQLKLSDVVSFHNYDDPHEFQSEIKWLERFHRPILCTEYMARSNGSTFECRLLGGDSRRTTPWCRLEFPISLFCGHHFLHSRPNFDV